jgi:hypothetical protein
MGACALAHGSGARGDVTEICEGTGINTGHSWGGPQYGGRVSRLSAAHHDGRVAGVARIPAHRRCLDLHSL